MGVAGDRLEARIAAAYTLRQFDADARRLGVTRMAGRAARDRKYLSDTLQSLGGEPWAYSSVRDNSWVPN